MGQICSICTNNNRLQIDRELVQGKTMASISRKYNVSQDSLLNHKQNHLSRQLIQHAQKQEFIGALDILHDIENLISRTKKILDSAESKNQYGLALKAIAEARGSYELLSKIAFALHQARLSELELEQIKTGQKELDSNEEFQQELKILSDEELQLLFLIQNKLESGNSHFNVLKEFSNSSDNNIFDQKPKKVLSRRTTPIENELDSDEQVSQINNQKELESLKARPLRTTPIPCEQSKPIFIKRRQT